MTEMMEEVLECTECVKDFPELLAKMIFYIILSILTTFANVLLVYVAFSSKCIVSNTKVFIGSLCVSHLLGSLIIIPLWVASRLVPDVVDQTIYCSGFSFVWILMLITSFYCLCVTSLDRYFIISNPMRYPMEATTKRKLVIVTAVWIVGVIFAGAPLLGWGEYTFQPDAIPICGLNWRYSLSYTAVLIGGGCILPLLLDIVSCTRILVIARRQSTIIEARKDSFGSSSSDLPMKKLRRRLNPVSVIFAGTGTYLLCWVPYITAHVWMVFSGQRFHLNTSSVPGNETAVDTHAMPYVLEFSVMFVALCNGLLSPLVILLTNKEYKKRIRRMLYKKCGLFAGYMEAEKNRYSPSGSIVRDQNARHLHDIFRMLHNMKASSIVSLESTCLDCGNNDTVCHAQGVCHKLSYKTSNVATGNHKQVHFDTTEGVTNESCEVEINRLEVKVTIDSDNNGDTVAG